MGNALHLGSSSIYLSCLTVIGVHNIFNVRVPLAREYRSLPRSNMTYTLWVDYLCVLSVYLLPVTEC